MSILITPIILELLGVEEYGLYNLIASLVAYLEVLNFGLGTAYIRYFSKYHAKNDHDSIAKLNGMFIVIFCVLSMIALIIGLGMFLNLTEIVGEHLTLKYLDIAKKLMLLMIFNMVISFPMSVINSHITAHEKFVFQNVIKLISALVRPLVSLLILLNGFNSVGMVIGATVLGIIVHLISIYYSLFKLHMKFRFTNFNAKLFKEIAHFSAFVFLGLIVVQINWNIDKFLLGRFVGLASVGIYTVGANLATYYVSFSQMLSNAFVPRVNKLVASGASDFELTKVMTRVARIQFFILSYILLGFTFLGRNFVLLWVGDVYINAYYVAVILMISMFISSIQRVGVTIQQAKNKHQFRSIMYFFIALGNLAISIPLCIKYGVVGCAVGTMVSTILGNVVVMNIYYIKTIKLDMGYFWKEILQLIPILILPILGGVLMAYMFSMESYFQLFLQIILFSFIYFTSIWFIGLKRAERNELTGKLKSKILKL